MTFAEIHQLGRDHDPHRLILKDHRTLFSAAANAATRSGLQSGAICSTARPISILITAVSASRRPARALLQARRKEARKPLPTGNPHPVLILVLHCQTPANSLAERPARNNHKP
jgi:hypothetical protein